MAAQRARGVRVEPRVHALDVERVLALRQEPEHLGGLELREADGAVETVLLSPQGSESEDWKRFHDGTVDAGVFPSGERCGSA